MLCSSITHGAPDSSVALAPCDEAPTRAEEQHAPAHVLRAAECVAASVPDGDAVRVLDAWRSRNPFYHRRIAEYLRFMIPEGESVLMIGCEDGALLSALRPARGVGIDSRRELIACARLRNAGHEYLAASDYAPCVDGQFEYVVINDVTDEVYDVFALLQYVATLCTPTSRIILIQRNHLWQPLNRVSAWFGSKDLRTRSNLLTMGDLRAILDGVGFETIYVRPKLFCPRRLLGFGAAVNWIGGLAPFSRRFASIHVIVARPRPKIVNAANKSATIVMAMRDERENVEPMVRAIPHVGAETQIVIVEGHSRDGTREEIERVIKAYPEKNIRLVVQTGEGVGNAIFEGFKAAGGDVIILLEADRTSPPQDVLKVFDVIASGLADYVNGSRFIYPRRRGSMPLVNVIGNRLFAAWFTWLLGQRTTDVLCGLKGIDRRRFQQVLEHWGFLGVTDPFSDFELVLGAVRLNLKICEVPTRYTSRKYGRTKARVFEHGWMLTRMAARAARVFRCR